jgi:ribosomal-protein-alanine N-acetyltransferase
MAIIVDPVSIEPMCRGDLEAIQRIDRKCFPTPWLPGAYATELHNSSAAYLVARVGRDVVGYGGEWVIAEEAHITTLAVDPFHQGRKIGERLLQALLEEAYLLGGSRSTLEVRENNRAAQALYRKYGYREAAIRKSYYTDNGENAIVMWADDIRSREFRDRLRALRRQLYDACEERYR